MKTLILFSSKHGAALKFAHLIAEGLPESTVVDVKEADTIAWEQYDRFILGSSIYAGRINKRFKQIVAAHLDSITQKELQLFFVGGLKEQYMKTAGENLPEALLKHASAIVYGGYIYDLTRLGFFERLVMRVVAKVKESKSALNEEGARTLARNFGGE